MSFWTIFCTFTILPPTPNDPENQNWKKWKECLEILPILLHIHVYHKWRSYDRVGWGNLGQWGNLGNPRFLLISLKQNMFNSWGCQYGLYQPITYWNDCSCSISLLLLDKTKQVCLLNNLDLNNYSFEFSLAETSAGGTLLYIANHLSYKCRNDLNICKKIELESTFIEIVNPNKSNIIVGVIYRHPSMDLTDFNHNYLNKLLENIF